MWYILLRRLSSRFLTNPIKIANYIRKEAFSTTWILSSLHLSVRLASVSSHGECRMKKQCFLTLGSATGVSLFKIIYWIPRGTLSQFSASGLSVVRVSYDDVYHFSSSCLIIFLMIWILLNFSSSEILSSWIFYYIFFLFLLLSSSTWNKFPIIVIS